MSWAELNALVSLLGLLCHAGWAMAKGPPANQSVCRAREASFLVSGWWMSLCLFYLAYRPGAGVEQLAIIVLDLGSLSMILAATTLLVGVREVLVHWRAVTAGTMSIIGFDAVIPVLAEGRGPFIADMSLALSLLLAICAPVFLAVALSLRFGRNGVPLAVALFVYALVQVPAYQHILLHPTNDPRYALMLLAFGKGIVLVIQIGFLARVSSSARSVVSGQVWERIGAGANLLAACAAVVTLALAIVK